MTTRNRILTGVLAAGAVIGATVLFTSTSNKNYYFSENGNDGNTGDIDHPFRSISKLNAIQSALQPGDSVLFEGNFYGSITINKSGTESKPIVYGSYGNGNATITGFTQVTSWTNLGGGIYESNSLSGVPDDVHIVTVKGNIVTRGRYPNSGWLLADNYNTNKTTIIDSDLPTSTNWTGAWVAIRKDRWVIDVKLITNHNQSNHLLTYEGGETNNRQPGYFITNSPKTLDSLYEWYYNPATQKLRIFSNIGEPQDVRISTKQIVINSNKNYIKFVNLNIEGGNDVTVNLSANSYTWMDGCKVNNSGNFGIKTFNFKFFFFENGSVTNSLTNGIELAYGSEHATVKNSVIKNTYMFAGMGGGGQGKGIGINARGKDTKIQHCDIINTGFCPIYFTGTDSMDISYNNLDSFCLVKDDGAGIYSWSGTLIMVNKDRVIHHNTISNGIGATEGTTGKGLFANSSYGIYFDLGSSFIDCYENRIYRTGRAGVYFHFVNNINFWNNTLAENQFSFYITRDATRDNFKNRIVGNTSYVTSNFHIKEDNFASTAPSVFGYIDSNNFINTSSLSTPFSIRSNKYSLTQWKTATPFDEHSKQNFISSTDIVKNVYSGSHNLIVDVDGYAWHNLITDKPFINPLPAYNSAILIRGEKLPEPLPEPPPSDTFNVVLSSDATEYTAPARITLTANDTAAVKIEFLFNSNHLYTDLTGPPFNCIWSNVRKGTYIFKAKATDKDGKVTISNEVTATVR